MFKINDRIEILKRSKQSEILIGRVLSEQGRDGPLSINVEMIFPQTGEKVPFFFIPGYGWKVLHKASDGSPYIDPEDPFYDIRRQS